MGFTPKIKLDKEHYSGVRDPLLNSLLAHKEVGENSGVKANLVSKV